MTIIIAIVIGIIIIAIIYGRYEDKCNACGKWGALEVFNKELINEKPTTVTKTLTDKVKNSKGKITKTVEKQIIVPGTKYTYKIHRKCKHCGNIVTHNETEVKED